MVNHETIVSSQGFADQERKLVEKTRELQLDLEKKDQEYRQNSWRATDKMKEQDVKIQRDETQNHNSAKNNGKSTDNYRPKKLVDLFSLSVILTGHKFSQELRPVYMVGGLP